ncbi:MAG TPA: cbb3-type cytochrome c oxidase subunit I [Chloroflexota bacterium]|nr:cbb3-type cytochrome c oxidase subunit I [Chloroflexota bacterium]
MATSALEEIRAHPLPRVTSSEGFLAWLKTTDHKLIGIMYLLFVAFFFVLGGFEALLMRWQLAVPQNNVISAQVFNQLFTMHGVTMIFLVVMPALIGFANYFVPIMIGYRDMAFPRLNAMSLWLLLFGGLLLYFSVLQGSMPATGWFAYANLWEQPYTMNNGPVFWAAGLTVLGAGSIATSLNLIVTIIAYRCPGMTLNRMPLFVWMVLVNSFLIIWAMPFLTADSILLLFDRFLGTHFFVWQQGGNVVMWQHLFWGFGHPEVYIMILPAFGMISEIIPVFSRKPLFGYTFVAFSGVAIGFISFIVWAHHMFTVGLSETEQAFFAATSMIIAVPTGVKIFNWLGTMWGGRIWWTTSMKFAAAFIIEFTIGGISGIMFSVVPLDYASTDTYFVVAHFHYVLFGGTMFILMAASYYWFPKITGRMLNERLGTWHFWLLVLGFNLTFFPQHFLDAMPRRVYTYTNTAWAIPNMLSSIGAAILFVAFAIFFYNIWISLRHGKVAGPNPWSAYSLEWLLPSPPPAYGFTEIPTVRSRRPLWDLAHPDQADWRFEHHAPAPAMAAPVPSGGGATAVATMPRPAARPAEHKGFQISPGRMLVLFFISSESIFFVSLIVMYSVYSFHFSSAQLNIPRTYWFSLALFASSGTMIIAEKFLDKGNKKMFNAWLIVTIALGLTFLIGQVTEYAALYHDNATISSHGEFGTTFFTLTGFHGFHVFVGLIALTTMLFLSRRWKPGYDTPLKGVGYYWHFVDGIWVFIFSIVYLRTLF